MRREMQMGSRTSISLEVNTVPPDTTAPVLTMTASDDQLLVDETATIRFTLSEASGDFTAQDVAVSGGTLSDFSGSGTDVQRQLHADWRTAPLTV